MDFDVSEWMSAGGEAEMSTESESACVRAGAVETGPGAHARKYSIGADDPASIDCARTRPVSKDRRLVGMKGDGPIEGEADTQCGGTVTEQLVQRRAANAQAGEGRKVSRDPDAGVSKRDAGERAAMEVGGNPESGEGTAGIGHKAFAAGFVDGRLSGVGQQDVGTAQAKGDGGSESGRAGANDQYVTVIVT